MNFYQFSFIAFLAALALAFLAWLGVFSTEFVEGFLTFWRLTLGYLEERPDVSDPKHVFGEMAGCVSMVVCALLGIMSLAIVGLVCEEFYRFLGRKR